MLFAHRNAFLLEANLKEPVADPNICRPTEFRDGGWGQETTAPNKYVSFPVTIRSFARGIRGIVVTIMGIGFVRFLPL